MRFAARILVTVAVGGLAAILRLTPQPGVGTHVLPAAVAGRLTLAGLGLAPFFACFGLLGLAAVGFRPTKAARLRVAAPLVAVLLALLGSAFLVASRNQLVREGVPIPPASWIVAISVGGTLALVLLGSIGTRYGVANGFLIVQAVDALASMHERAPTHVGIALAFALILLPLLSRRRAFALAPVPVMVEVPLVPAGVVALGVTLNLIVLPWALMSAIGLKGVVEFVRQPWIVGPLAAGLTVFFSFFVVALSFNPYCILHHAALRNASGDELPLSVKESLATWEGPLNRAVLTNGIGLGLIALASPFVATHGIDLSWSLWIGAILAGTVLDARDEWRGTGEGTVAEVGEAPGTLEADYMSAALKHSAIPVLVRGASSRLLVGAFGWFIPLSVWVPAEHEVRARELLDRDAPFLIGSAALDVARPHTHPQSSTGTMT